MTTCPYCGSAAEKVDGQAVYPHRPDLAALTFWRCLPCDARVGCHPGTERPLGVLARAAERDARARAHAAFDRLWKGGEQSRNQAYRWLAGELGIRKADCHIGLFDVATCERVITLAEGK